MKLSAKHQQQVVSYGDFKGGLNTSSIPEMIADNQMAECINMEFNRTTGALQTCCGTATLFECPDDITIDKLWYDEINNQFIFTDAVTRSVYSSRLLDMDGSHRNDRARIGYLTGTKPPTAVTWEDGLLIASGGKLQYWNGTDFITITASPSECNGVFVKNGRVYVWHDYRLVASAVGDETNWTDNTSDDSSSKWIDIGYKEGSKDVASITGACALSSDIVIIKNDGKIYRLVGEYPNWQVIEIARNLTPLNSQCYCAIQDGVFIVGREGMWLLQTTVDYGDVRPTNVAQAVVGLLGKLSVDASYVRFLPSLNQVWVAGFKNLFIVLDLNLNAFYQRKFNSAVNDICCYKEYFLLTREHKITELAQGVYEDEKYSDDEAPMEWMVIAKAHTSFYDFLLKRMRLTYVPLKDEFTEAQLITGNDRIKIDIPSAQDKSTPIYGSEKLIYGCTDYLVPSKTQFVTKQMIYRDKTFGIKLEGKGSAIIIYRIDAAIAEV